MISRFKFNGVQEVQKGTERIRIPIHPSIVLQNGGPIINVNITHSQKVLAELAKQGKQPQSYACQALIDTGAFSCVISPKVAQILGLLQTGFKNIKSVHTEEERPVFLGCVVFPWGSGKDVPLVSCELRGFDCIIGRDVMRHWYMTYDGASGELTICD